MSHRISPVPLLAGSLLFVGATALLCEDALHGHWHLNHLLQPLLMTGTIVAGVLAHHRLARLRVSGIAFLLLALLGSAAIIYATLSRTATARDAAQATALAENRQLANLGDELETARADAARECRSGFGPKCTAAKARVDQMVSRMSGLRSVSVDPRSDAIARLADLLGANGERVRAIVAALDPVVLPLFLEVGCILFFGAAFPSHRLGQHGDAQARANERKPDASVTAAPTMSQRELARAWGVHESTVSRRLRALEAAGRVQRVRRGRAVHCASSSPQALLPAPPR